MTVVLTWSGVRPACARPCDKAIEKQPACAAATSSSGFVPALPSNRVANVYAASESTALAAEIVPLPPRRSPFQTADALLSMNPPAVRPQPARLPAGHR